MNLPTQHQLVVAGSAVGVFASGSITMFGFIQLLNPAQVSDATQAVSMIGDGLAKIMTGAGTLAGLAIMVYNTIASGPFANLFRASKTIAADPAMIAQLQSTPLAQQAPLVAVTDKLPDVAGVGTTQTEAGKALAAAVSSTTVQPVATKSI